MDVEPTETRTARAISFGAVARAYAEHRPGYPAEAVRWLVGARPGVVLELGAGTGALTSGVLALGGEVREIVASDPSPLMLAELRARVPTAHALVASAEHIPLRPASVDLVLAGQALHWFDLDAALPEIARVLRPGGTLAVIRNTADRAVPWVRRLFALMGMPDSLPDLDPLTSTDLFTTVESRRFRHWQRMGRAEMLGLVATQSRVSVLSAPEHARLDVQVGELYDEYDRGTAGMALPWMTYAHRARVSGLANFRRESVGG